MWEGEVELFLPPWDEMKWDEMRGRVQGATRLPILTPNIHTFTRPGQDPL